MVDNAMKNNIKIDASNVFILFKEKVFAVLFNIIKKKKRVCKKVIKNKIKKKFYF